MNIGVFDSGIGGLTILKAILKKLPQYNYIYLGDTARVPYGGRSKEIIYQFTQEAVDFLAKKNCQLIIIACNTSTANALRKIQQEYLPKKYPHLKVLGVIKPTVEYLSNQKFKKVGVIATSATVSSNAFVNEIKKINPKIKVFQKACPLLVPYIENQTKNKKILTLLLEEYLKPLLKNNIEGLILGCTHYEIIEKEIKKIVGRKIKLIGEGEQVAEKLADYLKRHSQLEKKLSKEKKREYFFTDKNLNYQKLIKIFFNEKNFDKK